MLNFKWKTVMKHNPNGDTRTAPENVTIEKFIEANVSHQNDVRNLMDKLAQATVEAGKNHDWTKNEYVDQFYRDFIECKKNGDALFTNMLWYDNIHIKKERHHLLNRCPEDVDLIDVLEMCADCVAAGMARQGKFNPWDENNEELKNILIKALNNTAQKLVDNIVIE